ncbi:hypothetical protein RYX36_008043, partial [Vicia faba]
FKMIIEVVQDESIGKFVFWDHKVAELLKTSASEIDSTMIEDGITNPLEFPLTLDAMLGLKFSFKVNWVPRFRSAYLIMYLKDKHIIDQLESQEDVNGSEEVIT